ncbi:RNA polymerase sigma factor [Maribacter sp. LLG6340-A2]|uniref:RNA polymerase sigma factor n=1 Tax=Maribacter sp. LLG6340-A2 TaxID=3160834 RepID=UPI00386B19D4
MKHAYNSTEILIKALKKGESEAYKYLVDTYHQKLCAYAFGLIKDVELSEDIVQNVFIKIWKKRKKLDIKTNLSNYLYKSVYNKFIEQYRKERRVYSLEKIQIETINEYVQEDTNALDKLIKQIKVEIENLPPKCKQSFLLSKQEGLTNIEISEYLNISVKTVEGHITKAFTILRKNLHVKVDGILFILFKKKELLN